MERKREEESINTVHRPCPHLKRAVFFNLISGMKRKGKQTSFTSEDKENSQGGVPSLIAR